MNITVNGKLRTVPSGITILHLLQHFELGHERIAVEHNRSFRSRLMVGTGKYGTFSQMRDALAASGAQIVTLRSFLSKGLPLVLLTYFDINSTR